jgi:hypothetical protein
MNRKRAESYAETHVVQFTPRPRARERRVSEGAIRQERSSIRAVHSRDAHGPTGASQTNPKRERGLSSRELASLTLRVRMYGALLKR